MMSEGYGIEIDVGAGLDQSGERDVLIDQLQRVVGVALAGEDPDSRREVIGGVQFTERYPDTVEFCPALADKPFKVLLADKL